MSDINIGIEEETLQEPEKVDILQLVTEEPVLNKISIHEKKMELFYGTGKLLFLSLVFILGFTIISLIISFMINKPILNSEFIKACGSVENANTIINSYWSLHKEMIIQISDIVVPLLTLVIGYIFGNNESNK